MTINIEITATPDCSALSAIHAASFSKGWSREDIEQMLAVAGTCALVADGGFALVRLVAGEAEILTLAVHPLYQRKGVGSAIAAAILGWLEQQNAETVFLEVRESNNAAQILYKKAGFTQVSRRERYYGGSEAAIVMRLVLK